MMQYSFETSLCSTRFQNTLRESVTQDNYLHLRSYKLVYQNEYVTM